VWLRAHSPLLRGILPPRKGARPHNRPRNQAQGSLFFVSTDCQLSQGWILKSGFFLQDLSLLFFFFDLVPMVLLRFLLKLKKDLQFLVGRESLKESFGRVILKRL